MPVDEGLAPMLFAIDETVHPPRLMLCASELLPLNISEHKLQGASEVNESQEYESLSLQLSCLACIGWDTAAGDDVNSTCKIGRRHIEFPRGDQSSLRERRIMIIEKVYEVYSNKGIYFVDV